jgi:hypothetical protein
VQSEADTAQRLGERIDSQVLTPGQDVAEQVFGQTRRLAEGAAGREVGADQFFEFVAVVRHAGQPGLHGQPATQILGDAVDGGIADLPAVQTAGSVELGHPAQPVVAEIPPIGV